MKIVRLETWVVALPADEPLADAPENPGGTRPTVALELHTDEGITGIGITFLGAALTRTLRRAVHQLGELCIGADAMDMDAIVSRLHRLAGGSGPGGIFTLALAAVEIALWDIRGKALGKPLWKMVGASGNAVPTYASGAMMRGLDLDTAVRSAVRLVEAGFTSMKFQLAVEGGNPDSEEERARLIRQVVGPDVELMCDANQRWDFASALDIGSRLEKFGLSWIEDPIAHDDPEGLARLAEQLTTPIAAGEYLYGVPAFRQIIAARGLDVVMIDPFRAGGIGPWLRIAALAESNGLKVVSHLAPEIQLHLINAVPNGWTVEYMPWFNALYEDVAWPRNGLLEMPDKPGLGLAFDRNLLARHSVEREST